MPGSAGTININGWHLNPLSQREFLAKPYRTTRMKRRDEGLVQNQTTRVLASTRGTPTTSSTKRQILWAKGDHSPSKRHRRDKGTRLVNCNLIAGICARKLTAPHHRHANRLLYSKTLTLHGDRRIRKHLLLCGGSNAKRKMAFGRRLA